MLQNLLALPQFKLQREDSDMFCFFSPVPLTEETPSSFPVSFELIVVAQTI